MEISEIYKQYDYEAKERLEFKQKIERVLSANFLTFYERFIRWLDLGVISSSFVYSLLLFIIHISIPFFEDNTSIEKVFIDFSIFLPLLNGVGLFLLLSATEKLREFIANLIQISKGRYKAKSEEFLAIYRNRFLSCQTFLFGLSFGIINSVFAYLFGIPYLTSGNEIPFFEQKELLYLFSFIFQIFSIGFIGGVTINGIIVIINLIKKVSNKNEVQLMYFYPDKCAGTLIIGNILFHLSIHFIIIGIFIFIFIHNFPWNYANQEISDLVIECLIVFWKIFPFVLSAMIYFIPIRRLNPILKEYKLYEQLRIRKRLNFIAEQIMIVESDRPDSQEKIDLLDNHFQKLKSIDNQISEMNTWPYNLQYRSTFLAIFLPVTIGLILELSKNLISSFFK